MFHDAQSCCLHQCVANSPNNMQTWFGGCTQTIKLTALSQINYVYLNVLRHYLQSSSNIVTLACPGSSTLTYMGSEELSILSIKFSSLSDTLSLIMETAKEALVAPASNLTVYGPD